MSIRMTKRNGGADQRGRSIRPSQMGGAAKTPEDVAVAAMLLGRLPLFSGCTTEELERLAKSVNPTRFFAGDRLCVAGGDAPVCYIVAEVCSCFVI